MGRQTCPPLPSIVWSRILHREGWRKRSTSRFWKKPLAGSTRVSLAVRRTCEAGRRSILSRRMRWLSAWRAAEAGIPEPTARLINQLGSLFYAKSRYAEAERLYRRALAIDEATLGPDHPDVAIRLNNLANLLKATNRLAEAEPLMRRALAIDETSYGPDHPTVAIRLSNLAELLHDTNRLAEAEPLIPARARDRRGELWAGSSQGRDPPQQPRSIAAGHEPARGGRAFDAPRARD